MEQLDELRKYIRGISLLLESSEISIATTPAELVYKEDNMTLMHYIPAVKKPHPVPILIVYALVNRYYILDLQSEKSIVRKLLDAGFDVYIIDWGYPSGSDRYLTLHDYIEGYLENAVEKVRELSGIGEITLFGVCQGGTLSAMYASLHPEKVKNLVTVVTPIDFDTDEGLLHLWARGIDVDKMVDYYGIIPGDLLNMAFLLTDPIRVLIDKYVGLFERLDCDGDDEKCRRMNEETVRDFLRMEKWIYDSPGQAGEAYRQFIKECYQENLLIKNRMKIGGKSINLKNITMPLLNVMAKYDHLVPNSASKPLSGAVGSKDTKTLIFPTGHIGIFVGSKSQNEVCPQITEWLAPRSLLDGGKKRPNRAGEKPKSERRSIERGDKSRRNKT
jgi:polyhydroxyalkanoate synthase